MNALQSLVLCNSYRFARAMLHSSIAWYNVYVVVTIVCVCPLLVVFGNVLLRVPPFLDASILRSSRPWRPSKRESPATPHLRNQLHEGRVEGLTKVAPTEE